VTFTIVRAVLLIVLAFGVAGCQLRMSIGIDVDRNGAGVLAVSVGADQALLTKAKQAGTDPLDVLMARGRQLGKAGWRVTEDTPADGSRKVRLSASFDSPGEFNALASDLAMALAAPEIRLLEPFTLEVADDRITVTGGAGLQPTAAIAEVGVQPFDAVRLTSENAAIAYDVRVRLPGEVRSSTAPLQDGNILVWEVHPGQQIEVLAVGTRPPRSLLPILAVIAEALAAAGVAIAAVFRRRQQGRGRTAA
jgi:hypothetical protein